MPLGVLASNQDQVGGGIGGGAGNIVAAGYRNRFPHRQAEAGFQPADHVGGFVAVELQDVEARGGDGFGDGGAGGIDEQADAGDPSFGATGEFGGCAQAEVARRGGVENEAGIIRARRDGGVERGRGGQAANFDGEVWA